MPKPQLSPAPSQPDRVTRVLATMLGTILVLTVIAIVALFVLHWTGTPQSAFSTGGLQFVAIFPLPGIFISLVLFVVLIIINTVRRSRSQRS